MAVCVILAPIVVSPEFVARHPLHHWLASEYLLNRLRFIAILAGCCAMIAVAPWSMARRIRAEVVRNVHRYLLAVATTLLVVWAVTPAWLSESEPVSTLKVANRTVTRARFPVVDIHTHAGQAELDAESLMRVCNDIGVRTIVDLGGGLNFDQRMDRHRRFGDRYLVFRSLEGQTADDPASVDDYTVDLEMAHRDGVSGVKVWKDLGLYARRGDGSLIPIDDKRFEPVWSSAGRLGMPVLMHIADPVAYWSPIDRFNERYEELRAHPTWSCCGPSFPARDTLMQEFAHLLSANPATTFVGAHLASHEDDLNALGRLLDDHPNLFVDMSARVAALGRQPHHARKFFLRYADRILFGTDFGFGIASAEDARTFYQRYFEFLETDNDYMEYPLWPLQNQGRWRVCGLNLPDAVLERIYHQNAERLLKLSSLPAATTSQPHESH